MPTEDKLFSLGGLRQGRLYRQPKFMRTVDMFDMEQGGWMSQLCPFRRSRVGGTQGFAVFAELSSAESWDRWHLKPSLEEGLRSRLTSRGSRGGKPWSQGTGFNNSLLMWW